MKKFFGDKSAAGIAAVGLMIVTVFWGACSMRGGEASPEIDPANDTDNADHAISVTEEILTMDKLIDLCGEGREALAADMSRVAGGEDCPYSNFAEGETEDDGNLWRSYFCTLSYKEREYRLQVSYQKEEDVLDSIYIFYPAAGDVLLLYALEPQYAQNPDIRSFLDREYNMDEYLTLQLPDGLSMGTYQIDMNGLWQGCLFEGGFEEMPHGESCPEAWYAPGGIGLAQQEIMSDGLFFENGLLQSVNWMTNHGGCISDYEMIEGCQMQAVLCEYSFELFSTAESQEYWEKNGLTEEEFWSLSTSRYWYIFFAEEDSEYVYVLFLNQQYFGREDVVDMAKTVVFR